MNCDESVFLIMGIAVLLLVAAFIHTNMLLRKSWQREEEWKELYDNK